MTYQANSLIHVLTIMIYNSMLTLKSLLIAEFNSFCYFILMLTLLQCTKLNCNSKNGHHYAQAVNAFYCRLQTSFAYEYYCMALSITQWQWVHINYQQRKIAPKAYVPLSGMIIAIPTESSAANSCTCTQLVKIFVLPAANRIKYRLPAEIETDCNETK